MREGRFRANMASAPASTPRIVPHTGRRSGTQARGATIAHRPQTSGSMHQSARIGAKPSSGTGTTTTTTRPAMATNAEATAVAAAKRLNIIDLLDAARQELRRTALRRRLCAYLTPSQPAGSIAQTALCSLRLCGESLSLEGATEIIRLGAAWLPRTGKGRGNPG